MDSENLLVRPCHYWFVLDAWIKKKVVLVDNVRGYNIQQKINARVEEILGRPVPFWGAVQSHWIYNKEIMESMFSEINIWEAMNGQSIFESILYNGYAYRKSDLKYVNQRTVLGTHMPTNFFTNLHNRQTTVEYPLWGCDQHDDILDSYINYLRDSGESIANVCNADFYSVDRIVKETNVKQLTYMGQP